MTEDLIYWRHPTIPGIKVEEISGGNETGGRIWFEMARQIYCENGKEGYREIGHFRNGAPFLYGETSRISISHCTGLLVVATLPPTPEVELDTFSPRAALGIDAERADRQQALRLRERFLSEKELEMLTPDDVKSHVLAWTIKEAAYKAAMTEGLDFRTQIIIERLPVLAPPCPVFDAKEFGLAPDFRELPEKFFGHVSVLAGNDGGDSGNESDYGDKKRMPKIDLTLYSYASDECIVTLAYSPQCAKFGKAK